MRKLDYSELTSNLLIGRTPHRKDYALLQEIGITLVINMRAEWPSTVLSRNKTIAEIWMPSVDNPLIPFNQEKLYTVAKTAVEEIDSGGRVYVYCRKGRHRIVVMVSAILLLQGLSLGETSKLITSKRRIADLEARQVRIAIRKFEQSHRR